MISFNNPCLECKFTYDKLYFGICCKSLALAFGTTFALNMVRALLMFPLKEVETSASLLHKDQDPGKVEVLQVGHAGLLPLGHSVDKTSKCREVLR